MEGDKSLNTIIGRGTLVEGKVHVQNSLRVDGTVKGDIKVTETVTVGKTGVVEASIQAKNAILGGKVIGPVNIQERAELENGSSLTGDLVSRQLIISEGAFFQGKSTMGTDSARPPKPNVT